LENISCSEAAGELLRECVAGEPWNGELVDRLAHHNCTDALFRILAEGLADRFEARLCDDYAAIFSLILEEACAERRAADLYARYRRIRRPRVCTVEPSRILVLSRVTLGADIAVTSVVLNALASRFPGAEISLAGSPKAAELFSANARIRHLGVSYERGSMADRLHSYHALCERLRGDEIVVDPDSRLTQLGLLEVCPEDRYFFFESRAYGGDGDESLTALTQKWVAETFGAKGAMNRIFPPSEPEPDTPYAAVSLGAGDKPRKQLPEEFEAALIRLLCSRFPTVIVDSGFGAEESARVARAVAGTSALTWTGSFARFASLIAKAECYVGYDSAGQHAAAACGTPLLTLFKGFISDKMFARWQPTGPGPKEILKIHGTISIGEVASALDRLIRKP
jgi:ADP-heptose:LPS heptosyltransferase